MLPGCAGLGHRFAPRASQAAHRGGAASRAPAGAPPTPVLPATALRSRRPLPVLKGRSSAAGTLLLARDCARRNTHARGSCGRPPKSRVQCKDGSSRARHLRYLCVCVAGRPRGQGGSRAPAISHMPVTPPMPSTPPTRRRRWRTVIRPSIRHIHGLGRGRARAGHQGGREEQCPQQRAARALRDGHIVWTAAAGGHRQEPRQAGNLSYTAP